MLCSNNRHFNFGENCKITMAHALIRQLDCIHSQGNENDDLSVVQDVNLTCAKDNIIFVCCTRCKPNLCER